MTKKEREQLRFTIDNEGLDYALRFKFSVGRMKDEKLKKLHAAYVEAANAIEKYIGVNDEESDIPW